MPHRQDRLSQLRPIGLPSRGWFTHRWCATFSDRWSASLINVALRCLFSDVAPRARVGFVLSPAHTQLHCSFASDGGTQQRVCTPRGRSASCVPGCWKAGEEAPPWCDLAEGAAPSGNPLAGPEGGGHSWCPWPANQLKQMLQQHVARRAPYDSRTRCYNEVVVDVDAMERALPHSIEAVVLVAYEPGLKHGPEVYENGARSIHQSFLLEFGLSSEVVPLLEFKMTATTTAPFKEI